MKIWKFLTIPRCRRCLKELDSISKSWDAIHRIMGAGEFPVPSTPLPVEIIEGTKEWLVEKEQLLKKKEELFDKEREMILGKEGAEVRRDILLPSLKKKWEAEKEKIDAERVMIIKRTPRVQQSLEARKTELQKIITTIKNKPGSTANHDLLKENEGRLDELNSIINIIDKEKLHVA